MEQFKTENLKVRTTPRVHHALKRMAKEKKTTVSRLLHDAAAKLVGLNKVSNR